MGTKIKDIVNVTITRETAKISKAGFGTPLILGIHANFVENYRIYTSIYSVLEDFAITDEEYKAANAIFSQDQVPERIVIGKRAANVSQQELVTVSNVQNNVTYTVTIDGTAFDYLSDADATADEISLGLTTAINLGVEPVTASDNVGTLDLDADVLGEPFTVVVSDDGIGDGLTVANAILNVNVASELAALIGEFNDWYALINTRRATEAEQLQDIEQAAVFIESQIKIFGYSIDQADMITALTTDIASILKGKALDRTFGIYSEDQANYPEAALLGLQLPKDPGSSTWKFKSLSLITPDTLSDTATINLGAKNANFYETVANVNIISGEGVVAGGEFLDIIRGADWLQARMSERIFTRLINSEKVPYTADGIAAIETDMRAQLDEAVAADFVTPDYTIVTPDIDNVDPGDKAVRFLDGMEFEAPLVGAVHKTKILGRLVL